MTRRRVVLASILGSLLLALPWGTVCAPIPPFPPLPQFGDSIHDYGVDSDHDGDFDELRIDFSVRVVEDAKYWFEAQLTNENLPLLFSDPLVASLTSGEHTLTVSFLAPYIRKANAWGPYVVRLQASVFVGDIRYGSTFKSYATSSYDPAQFDPPGALFADSVTDAGRDTNGDGLFDYIVVRLSVEAIRDVVVTVDVSMSVNGLDGWATVASPFGDSRRLPPGTWAIEFPLETLPLFTIHANGPYTVELRLAVEGLGLIDHRTHKTQAYVYTQFRGPSADFRPPGPSLDLADPDENGLANFLVVHVPLRVSEAGDFVVSVYLWLSAFSGGFFQSGQGAHLEPGDHTVDVPFSGIALSRHPFSAEWTLEVIVKRADSTEYDRIRTAWVTPGYEPTLFELRPLIHFSGRLVWPEAPDGWNCGSVALLDPSTKFAVEQSPNYGAFSFSVYPGTFLVLVSGCSPAGARTSRVTISGDTQLVLTLGNSTPNSHEIDVNMTSWNSTRRTIRSTLIDAAPELRFYADMYGNRDGFANSTEVRIIRAANIPGYFPRGYPTRSLAIDGRALPFRSLESYDLDGAGDVLSPAEVTETQVENYWSYLESRGGGHNVTIWLNYDGPLGASRVTIHLPAGATGTATSSGNVTIVPLGLGAWMIDPGTPLDPTPFRVDWAVVYIDALGPPPPEEPSRAGPFGFVLDQLPWILASAATTGMAIGVIWWIRRRWPPGPSDRAPREERRRDGA